MSVILTFALTLASQLAAVPVDSILARQTTPIAPRGGVLMVQLLTDQQGDAWPSTLAVTFEDGGVVTGHIGWVEKNSNTTMWTSNPSSIRPITPTDNTSLIDPMDASSGPVLLVSLPIDAHGIIRFGGDAIEPQWIDLPTSLPNIDIFQISDSTLLSEKVLDDMPEWNPLEYWRWTLVASRRGMQPPEPPNDSTVATLAALQGAQLWRAGFDRLARSSRGVAAACRDLLTNTVNDGTHSFACWVVRPEPLHQLLSTLLDEQADSRQLAMRVMRWIENQQPYILWVEQVFGDHVSIAIANPTLEDSIATMRWQSGDDIPIAIELPATQTAHAQAVRMPVLDLSLFGPVSLESQIEWLAISMGRQTTSLPIVPKTVVAMPPSVLMQTLHPLWTLTGVQTGQPTSVAPQHRTVVQVRKLLGRWEIFVQCLGFADGATLPLTVRDPIELRGVEAITILHPPTNSILSITPQGEQLGSSIPSDLELYTSISENLWVARIVLPNAWVRDEQLSFSVVRTHGNSSQIETGPLPCVPWAIKPAPIIIDLAEWDTIQRFPTHLQIK